MKATVEMMAKRAGQLAATMSVGSAAHMAVKEFQAFGMVDKSEDVGALASVVAAELDAKHING